MKNHYPKVERRHRLSAKVAAVGLTVLMAAGACGRGSADNIDTNIVDCGISSQLPNPPHKLPTETRPLNFNQQTGRPTGMAAPSAESEQRIASALYQIDDTSKSFTRIQTEQGTGFALRGFVVAAGHLAISDNLRDLSVTDSAGNEEKVLHACRTLDNLNGNLAPGDIDPNNSSAVDDLLVIQIAGGTHNDLSLGKDAQPGDHILATGYPPTAAGSAVQPEFVTSSLIATRTGTNSTVLLASNEAGNAIRKGNSGGPLVNTAGQVIGVTNAMQLTTAELVTSEYDYATNASEPQFIYATPGSVVTLALDGFAKRLG